MPIRVQCPSCGDVTHFADNDAGLVVNCLACRARMTVPKVEVEKTAPAPVFSDDPAHRPLALPDDRPKHHPEHGAGEHRPVLPARPKSKWRMYSVLGLAIAGAGIWGYNSRAKQEPVNSTPAVAVAQSQPTSGPTVVVAPKSSVPVIHSAAVAPMATTDVGVDGPKVKGPELVVAKLPPPRPVTYTPAGAPLGFVGLTQINMGGRIFVDSYDATKGRYVPKNAGEKAPILSNGPIQLQMEGEVRGSVQPGVGTPAFKPTPQCKVTGSTDPLAQRLSGSPVKLDPFSNDSCNSALPSGHFQNGNLTVVGSSSLTLPGGVYYLNDVVVDAPATLTFEGPVTLLVSGRLAIAGGVITAGNLPANCRVRVTGEQPVSITSPHAVQFDLYAPLSPISITGNGDLFGSITGRILTISGNRNLHFDESLLPANDAASK